MKSLKLDSTLPVKVNASALHVLLNGLDALESLKLVNIVLDTPQSTEIGRHVTNRLTRNRRADFTLSPLSAFTINNSSAPATSSTPVTPRPLASALNAARGSALPTTINAPPAPFTLSITGNSASVSETAPEMDMMSEKATVAASTETASPIIAPATESSASSRESTLESRKSTHQTLNFSFGRIFPRLKHLLLEGVFPNSDSSNAIWLKELIQDLNYLENIDLRRNHLPVIPADTFAGANATLRRIYMIGNNISELAPRSLAGLRQLEILDLFNNRLERLDANLLRDLVTLSHLRIGQNLIKTLPESIFSSNAFLKALDLSNNRNLTHLPDKLLKPLTMLQNFTLNDCNMTRISPTPELFFANAPSLERISMNGNLLSNLTAANMFGNNARLQRLSIAYNSIRSISPSVFSANTNSLRELNLYGNDLTFIEPTTFSTLKNIRVLRLGYNNFTTFPLQLLFNMRYLEEFDLSRNQLQSINPKHSRIPVSLQLFHSSTLPLAPFRCDFVCGCGDSNARMRIVLSHRSFA